jgi:ATP-binding cassette subfamily F protein 3
MDEVTTHTMGIWRQKLVKVKGNSEKYFEQLIAEEEVYEKTRQNIERKRKDLEEFVNRFKAKASKATQAQSRMKMLEKMTSLEELAAIATLDFSFHYKECPGKILLELKDLSFGYTDENLVSDLNLSVQKGDKIAVIGKNGRGKSTLLNLIGKELTPKTGSVYYNPNTLPGHFGQTNITRLEMQKTIEEEITSADPMMSVQKARNIAGTMMFTGDLSQKKISVLSGGERARVLLGKILARPTNLLLLDEPTNHLDQNSVDALIDELVDYEGAAIVVTHSEDFLRRYANKLIVFQNNKVEFLPYTYDEFLEKIGWEDESLEKKQTPKSDKISRADAKRMRSELVVERSRALSSLKKEMEKLEKQIVKDEEDIQKVENQLVNDASTLDGKKISELSQRLGALKKDVDTNFEKLTEITMEHDEKFASYESKLKELDV